MIGFQIGELSRSDKALLGPRKAHIRKYGPNLIEEYNESLPEDSDYTEVDTVDLSMKFDDMRDYVEDYSN